MSPSPIGDAQKSLSQERDRWFESGSLQRIEYNYRHSAWQLPDRDNPVARVAAMCGTDAATFTRERPGMSAFVLEGGVVCHTYSTYARGLDANLQKISVALEPNAAGRGNN
jgi:predicted dithiol-disulfide oxidoreductase (DUF899 family)